MGSEWICADVYLSVFSIAVEVQFELEERVTVRGGGVADEEQGHDR